EPGFNGGPNGNLWIFVRVMPHEYFSRRGKKNLLDIKKKVGQAGFGAPVTVATGGGGGKLINTPGNQAGENFSLRGKGLSEAEHQRPARRPACGGAGGRANQADNRAAAVIRGAWPDFGRGGC